VFIEFVDDNNSCVEKTSFITGATLTLTALPVEVPSP